MQKQMRCCTSID